MLAMKRSQYIMEQLESQKVVLVSALSKAMAVTEETVRRDLEKLEKQGFLCRVHGGAYLAEGYGHETPVSVREQICQQEKMAIAQSCLKLIQDKDSVMLDCSTTAGAIAKELVASGKTVTIITNSLLVAKEAAKGANLRLIQLGGEFNQKLNAFFGEATLQALDGYYADMAFISGAGLNWQAGVTDYTQDEASVRRAMIAHSALCYFAGDLTKMGRMGVHAVAPLTCLKAVIVDQPLEAKDEPLSLALQNQNIPILVGDLQKPN